LPVQHRLGVQDDPWGFILRVFAHCRLNSGARGFAKPVPMWTGLRCCDTPNIMEGFSADSAVPRP
jgi:hypothetical protein